MARMEFGIFLDLSTETETLDRHLERWLPLLASAERAGFTSVSLGEAHPKPPGGYQHVPSPLIVLAALAGRTSMELGTGVVLLPTWDVHRLAWDVAMLDQLSGGRFFLGVGVGNAAAWKLAGLDPATVGRRMDEQILALRALWRGEPGFHGELVSVEGPIGPAPTRPGGPPIWVGGKIRRTARRAAELGDGLVLGTHFRWPHVTWLIDEYRAALADLGRPAEDARIAANRFLVLAEDPETAWRDAGPYLGRILARYAALKMLAGPGVEALVANGPDDLEAVKAAAADVCLVGSPETVVAELDRIAAAGVSQLQVRPAPMGLPSELAARTIELAGRDLIPRFG